MFCSFRPCVRKNNKKMRFLFYLSKRTLFHRQSDQFIPFIRVLAVAGLMIGTAAMAITMGILHGFEKNLVEKISDFESHCRIESFRDKLEIDFDYMEKIQRHPDVIQMAPYLDLNVMVRKNDETEGIILQCLQQPDFMEILSKSKKNMSGKVDFRAGRQLPGIYLGQGAAQSLNATTGDTVDVLMLNGIPSLFNPLKTYPAIITGVFNTGMKEFDAGYGYTSLYFGQLKVKRSSIITGYQLLLTDPMKASEICEWIEDKSDYHYMAMTWKERNRILFRWLETQKAPILITFGIIALVAVFNIVSTLVMIVLVKEKDIAVLKSMGMTPRNIRRKY